jgi:hypothetical protein
MLHVTVCVRAVAVGGGGEAEVHLRLLQAGQGVNDARYLDVELSGDAATMLLRAIAAHTTTDCTAAWWRVWVTLLLELG